MRRTFLVGLSLVGVLVVVGCVVFVPVQYIIADGAFPLTVSIRPSGKQSISSIEVAVAERLDTAEESLKLMLAPGFDPRSVEFRATVKKDPWDRSDLIINVPWSEHIWVSLIGHEIFLKSEHQPQGLVVFAIMGDGKRVGKAIEIPRRNKSHEVTVILP